MNRKKRNSKARQAFCRGTFYDPPKKLSAYEVRLEDLGLQAASLEEILANTEIVKWVTKNRHERYCPELLLHKLGLDTIWSGGKSRGRISYADVRAYTQEVEKTSPALISTR
jgi:hypothetical protein